MARQTSRGKSSAHAAAPVAAKAEAIAQKFDLPVHDAQACLTKLVDAFAKDLRGSPDQLWWALSHLRLICLKKPWIGSHPDRPLNSRFS